MDDANARAELSLHSSSTEAIVLTGFPTSWCFAASIVLSESKQPLCEMGGSGYNPHVTRRMFLKTAPKEQFLIER